MTGFIEHVRSLARLSEAAKSARDRRSLAHKRKMWVTVRVEGLLGRGDVVTERGKQDDRGADGPQVEGVPFGPFGATGCELVADEQVVDDPLDLFPVHQEEAAPPALKFQKALRLCVDLGKEVVV